MYIINLKWRTLLVSSTRGGVLHSLSDPLVLFVVAAFQCMYMLQSHFFECMLSVAGDGKRVKYICKFTVA